MYTVVSLIMYNLYLFLSLYMTSLCSTKCVHYTCNIYNTCNIYIYMQYTIHFCVSCVQENQRQKVLEEKREKARKEKERKAAEKKTKTLAVGDTRKSSKDISDEDDNNLVDRLLSEIRAGTKLRRSTKRTSSARRGTRRGLGISEQDAAHLQQIAKLATVAVVVNEKDEVKENGSADHSGKEVDSGLPMVKEAWAS